MYLDSGGVILKGTGRDGTLRTFGTASQCYSGDHIKKKNEC
jgi:hypothetical protein